MIHVENMDGSRRRRNNNHFLVRRKRDVVNAARLCASSQLVDESVLVEQIVNPNNRSLRYSKNGEWTTKKGGNSENEKGERKDTCALAVAK